MEEKIWERRDDEGADQYQTFCNYLQMVPRNASKCAEMAGKSASTINRWAARYDWRQRATAYDSALLEETRQTIKQQLPRLLLRQWQDSADIFSAAAAELKRRDLSKASFKSLNEIAGNFALQMQKITEQLKIFDNTGDSGEMTIRIVDAEGREMK